MRRRNAWLSAGAVALAFVVWACTDSKGPTAPDPVQAPAEAPAPSGSASSPAPVAPPGSTWTENGLRVTITRDDWGPGSCHSNGGTRTYLLENVGDVERYSNLAAFTDDTPTCATDKTPTGVPRFDTTCRIGSNGGPLIAPGESCSYSVHVTFPKGSDGVCALQVDDCFGPGGIRECSFVVGDSFKVPDAQCEKVCVEDPTTTSSTECGEWGECHEHPESEQCFEHRECLETTTTDFVCKPDTTTTREFEESRSCVCKQCVPEWSEWELVDRQVGEWGECLPVPTVSDHCGSALPAELPAGLDFAGDVSASCRPRCERTRTIVDTFERVEKCTKETEQRTDERIEREPCDCPETCVLPPEGAVLSWSGRGDPATECAAFDRFGGPFEPGRPADFWICKAGNDREVWFTPPGPVCRNGRDRSHTVECRCVPLD